MECISCKEISGVISKTNEEDSQMACITEYSGFAFVCLDVWVIQIAYYQYRQHSGADQHSSPVN